MTPSRPSDVSLYELAINSPHPPQPLQLSPTTFKSMVGNVLDLVIDQGLPATLWLKLPRGEAWETDVDRFCQLATAPYSLYSLHSQQEQTAEKSKIAQAIQSPPRAVAVASSGDQSRSPLWNRTRQDNPDEVALLDDHSEMATLDTTDSIVYPLPLAADSQLRREYFLMVVSSGFCGVILAHRPRSSRSKIETLSSAEPANGARSNPTADEALEQKHPLLGLCSFEQTTLRQVLDGINSAIRFGQPFATEAELADLVVSWDSLLDRSLITSLNPSLLSSLLTKQVQRQEEIWRGGAVHRRQADLVSALQRENHELLKTLRLKDEFVKNLGQELRTPLTNMKTALSLLNSPNLKPQQRQRYMDMLSQECDRQSSLISGVLDLLQLEGGIEHIPLEPLRLIDVVPGVVSTYQPLAQEKGVMLAYTIPEDLPPVACLQPWLKQIVINLLHNSIKFTSSGGQVWVRAKQQADAIHIEFRDTGVGIAAAEVPKIFDRFYRIRQGSDDPGGVGLGLAIVQQLLLRCGGSITVKSKPGEGSVFSVALAVYQK